MLRDQRGRGLLEVTLVGGAVGGLQLQGRLPVVADANAVDKRIFYFQLVGVEIGATKITHLPGVVTGLGKRERCHGRKQKRNPGPRERLADHRALLFWDPCRTQQTDRRRAQKLWPETTDELLRGARNLAQGIWLSQRVADFRA